MNPSSRAWAARRHPGYAAFLAHRVSGVLLAIFLPAHFLVLGLALEDAAALDGFLRWTEAPLVKLAEWGLTSPRTVITVGLQGIGDVTIRIGDKTPDGISHYTQFRSPGDSSQADSSVYLIDSSWGDVMERLVNEPPYLPTPTPEPKEPTPTPKPEEPSGDPEMRLNVTGGNCDHPIAPTICHVPFSGPFLLSVEVVTAPEPGYILAQTFIDFGGHLAYKPPAS
ncbi:MAG: hypothetical protein IH805_08275, partial [Proteobacteria bacterium]|nr:hypothetical protein [Pseudomonadota bacterium]